MLTYTIKLKEDRSFSLWVRNPDNAMMTPRSLGTFNNVKAAMNEANYDADSKEYESFKIIVDIRRGWKVVSELPYIPRASRMIGGDHEVAEQYHNDGS